MEFYKLTPILLCVLYVCLSQLAAGTLSSESKQRPEEAGQMGGELPICIPGPSTVWNKSHPQMNYPRPGTSKVFINKIERFG